MRKALLTIAAIVVIIWWLSPGSARFGCGSDQASAHAAAGSCPSSLEGAAEDAEWAADRIASMPVRGDGDPTTGLLYDSDGIETRITSGESGAAYEAAKGYISLPSKQVAGHVEAKAAATMRDAGETYAVLVLNNQPCTWASGVGCLRASAMILPSGSTMVLWWPNGGPTTVRGRA
ncbi:DddA-like double-stranded DNA deaminase toxin [Saccharopolyspora shandongensis]|uniref:DddA-like double-stranded DNA deaminase toxin n=1 Tax=Saccharopolyspora shandongensis TaxID=418495 RepID=UPI0033C85F62